VGCKEEVLYRLLFTGCTSGVARYGFFVEGIPVKRPVLTETTKTMPRNPTKELACDHQNTGFHKKNKKVSSLIGKNSIQ
jgi:hypothetical protein